MTFEAFNRLLRCNPIYQTTSVYNGYQLLHLEKIVACIIYFQYYIQHLTEEKLHCLLWFSDHMHFQEYTLGITGLAYERVQAGVKAVGVDELMPSLIKGESLYEEALPLPTIHQIRYTAGELACLDRIALEFEKVDVKKLQNTIKEMIRKHPIKMGQYLPYSLQSW